jgi:hypothetical protein
MWEADLIPTMHGSATANDAVSEMIARREISAISRTPMHSNREPAVSSLDGPSITQRART